MIPPNIIRRATVSAHFRYRVLLRDGSNVARFGLKAPRIHQLIWLDPTSILRRTREFGAEASGLVRGGDWDSRSTQPLMTDVKLAACIAHWRDGVDWAETGVYDYVARRIRESGGRFDNCSDEHDIVARYSGLDQLFHAIREDGRVRTRAEVSPGTFREKQGIGVHIDRSGSPVFSHRGTHRLAAALVLGFEVIPAQLGVVHRSVARGGRWTAELISTGPGAPPATR